MRLAVTVMFVVACDSGISFGEFADEERDARCDYYVRCGSFSTASQCRYYLDAFRVDNKNLVAAVDAGKIRYDEGAAESCVTALRELSCDTTEQTAEELAPCADVYTGTGQQGASCAFDGECASDRCVVPDCQEACCLGTCEPPRVLPGLGEQCVGLCEGDLYCGVDDRCHAPASEGEPCSVTGPCGAGLYCRDSTRVCTVLPQRGEYCDLVCAQESDLCSSDGVCVKAGVADDPCSTDADCSRFYRCDIERERCAPRPGPTGSVNGTPCSGSSDCVSRYCDGTCMDVPLCF